MAEYDEVVKPWKRSPVAVLALALVALLSVIPSTAQIHAAPPSVTSMGFGGRAFNGAPPSVTSLGPRGAGFNPAFPSSRPFFGTSSTPGFGSHGPHHRPRHPEGNVAYYGVPYYGYYDNGYYDNGTDGQNYVQNPVEDEYDGGAPPRYAARAPEPGFQAEANPAPPEETSQPSIPTVLVFKDGHQLEVQNYAIVGTTLYDLTEGHRRKVALSELDLTATSQQNDDRGIDFHLPAGVAGN